MRPLALILFASALGCATNSSSSEADVALAPQESGEPQAQGEGGSLEPIASVVEELPAELLGTLKLRGDDVDGRLLTVAGSFIATAECSDCGAPSYLRFLAVRCTDGAHCEVLTEQCEGSIARGEDNGIVVFMHAVEGAETPEVCASYSGTFDVVATSS